MATNVIAAKALFEQARYAPLWSGTSGIYANLSKYPEVEYYVKCPKCGNVHGDYASMKEAHLRRLCKVCELEKTNKLKDWIHGVVYPETPEPGKKPMKMKTVQQVIGVKESEEPDPSELANQVELNWVQVALRELEELKQFPVKPSEDFPLAVEEADELSTFDVVDGVTGSLRGHVHVDEETAKADALRYLTQRLTNDPGHFDENFLRQFVDNDKLTRSLDDLGGEDPWEYLTNVFGEVEGRNKAAEIGGLNIAAAANAALTRIGWRHVFGRDVIFLPSGSIVVPS